MLRKRGRKNDRGCWGEVATLDEGGQRGFHLKVTVVGRTVSPPLPPEGISKSYILIPSSMTLFRNRVLEDITKLRWSHTGFGGPESDDLS